MARLPEDWISGGGKKVQSGGQGQPPPPTNLQPGYGFPPSQAGVQMMQPGNDQTAPHPFHSSGMGRGGAMPQQQASQHQMYPQPGHQQYGLGHGHGQGQQSSVQCPWGLNSKPEAQMCPTQFPYNTNQPTAPLSPLLSAQQQSGFYGQRPVASISQGAYPVQHPVGMTGQHPGGHGEYQPFGNLPGQFGAVGTQTIPGMQGPYQPPQMNVQTQQPGWMTSQGNSGFGNYPTHNPTQVRPIHVPGGPQTGGSSHTAPGYGGHGTGHSVKQQMQTPSNEAVPPVMFGMGHGNYGTTQTNPTSYTEDASSHSVEDQTEPEDVTHHEPKPVGYPARQDGQTPKMEASPTAPPLTSPQGAQHGHMPDSHGHHDNRGQHSTSGRNPQPPIPSTNQSDCYKFDAKTRL